MMGYELQAVLAGFGGQGVLFAGKVIANAGLIENRELSWLPSYGPEMRGGTANCSVTLSDEPIGSPLVTVPNALIAMNQPSFDKFSGSLAPDAAVVYDSDLIDAAGMPDNVRACGIPASGIAEDEQLQGLSNIILLGKLWALTKFCSRETIDQAIEKSVPPKKAHLIEKNKLALELGINA